MSYRARFFALAALPATGASGSLPVGATAMSAGGAVSSADADPLADTAGTAGTAGAPSDGTAGIAGTAGTVAETPPETPPDTPTVCTASAGPASSSVEAAAARMMRLVIINTFSFIQGLRRAQGEWRAASSR